MTKKLRVAGINFSHMHMGDLLRMAAEHPGVEIVGICHDDPERMAASARNFNIPPDRIFTDAARCLEQARPELVILCPATADHGEWVRRVAPFGAHVMLEKPFATTLADADSMLAAMRATGALFAINWPLAWYPAHVTSKRLIDSGMIGAVTQVHYYNGNRGPLRHTADKIETMAGHAEKVNSWWYQKASGGGSLLDYLGYGTTLGTWYHNGAAPSEVSAMVDQPAGLEVDEQSVTIARYATGLSTFQTRWGAFTDPWTLQPQPKCGFVINGTEGTVSSYDYEPTVRVQTRAHPEGVLIPVDVLQPPFQNPIQYVAHCIQTGQPVSGPLDPAICRIGQQIVDSAQLSAAQGRTVALVN